MNRENVSADAIGKSAPEQLGPAGPIGPDPLTRDPVLDQHLGKVGQFIGGGPEKPRNISYVVGLASIFMLIVSSCAVAYVDIKELESVFSTLITGCLSLITGALGFIFGKSGKD